MNISSFFARGKQVHVLVHALKVLNVKNKLTLQKSGRHYLISTASVFNDMPKNVRQYIRLRVKTNTLIVS